MSAGQPLITGGVVSVTTPTICYIKKLILV